MLQIVELLGQEKLQENVCDGIRISGARAVFMHLRLPPYSRSTVGKTLRVETFSGTLTGSLERVLSERVLALALQQDLGITSGMSIGCEPGW